MREKGQSGRGLSRRPVRTTHPFGLREIIQGQEPVSDELGLIHITSTGYGREIINSGKLEIKNCSVFHNKLVYFFFGRPVYRLTGGDEKTDIIGRFPIAFVFSAKDLGSPFHVYPFDTGAAHRGLFDSQSSPGDFLDDFELEPTIEGARKHIGWAFENNSAYFEGDIRSGLINKIEEWHTVARGYIRIAGLAATGNNTPDKRAAAIEIAYERNVPLKANLQLVILPKQFVENVAAGSKNERLLASLKESGANWEMYDWRPHETPNFYLDTISHIVRQYFIRNGNFDTNR